MYAYCTHTRNPTTLSLQMRRMVSVTRITLFALSKQFMPLFVLMLFYVSSAYNLILCLYALVKGLGGVNGRPDPRLRSPFSGYEHQWQIA